MSQNITIELNSSQREVLLTGLRFVRSSAAMTIEEWSEEVESDRHRQYELVDGLVALLDGVPHSRTANVS